MALYLQDTISRGNWAFNLGLRGDLYNGLTVAHQAEPRVGVAYNIKPSNTVLRVSYARTSKAHSMKTLFSPAKAAIIRHCESDFVLLGTASQYARLPQ